MPSVRLWVNPMQDPEMDPADKSWIRQQPLQGFLQHLQGSSDEERKENYPEWKGTLVEEILRDYPGLTNRILNWLYFAINGGSLPQADAVGVFLDYFMNLFLDKEDKALACLREAQVSYVSAPLPSKFHMQKNGDDEEEEDEEDEQDEVDDDDECELLQVYWEAKTPKKWRTLIRTDTDVQLKVCQLWADALYVFFERTEDLPASIKKGAVQALQQMRKINKAIWTLDSWRTAVKDSGLAAVMTNVCQSCHLFEVQSPHVVETYRYNVWRETLGEILLNWTPHEMAERKIEVVPLDDLATERIPCTAENILELMCKHVEMVPRLSHPSAVFFLISYDNFLHAWEVWLEGALRHQNVKTTDVNLWQLHRALRGIKLEAFAKTHVIPEQLKVILDETELLVRGNRFTMLAAHRPNTSQHTGPPPKKKKRGNLDLPADTPEVTPSPSPSPSRSPSPSPHPNPPPYRIINSSDIPTYSLAELPEAPNLDPSQQFAMPKELKNTCKHCRDNPDEDQWCIRRYYVHELPNYEELDGCVITTAPEDECLDPKAKEGSSSPQYYHPDELGLKQIKPRPEVFDLCKRDVTLLVNDDSILVSLAQASG
ncbi:hypothetical protein BDN71DRAFT_1514640 [Pleurotus eryngii]|uniref:Uncharacterized protein n=1 Tax=Pleurotus eryngii TaxID=5323 RepID=A0A9P6CZT2_PLEER|nr:hypothetical protein BDN71DRAFT_1514640 [Pleurotus eryngii]